MNGTGTGTSAGRSAGHPEPRAAGGEHARPAGAGSAPGPADRGGSAHPVGPADATGPLPARTEVDPAAATEPGSAAIPQAAGWWPAQPAGAGGTSTTSDSWFGASAGSSEAGVSAAADTASWPVISDMPGEPTGALPVTWQYEIPGPWVSDTPAPAADLFDATRSPGTVDVGPAELFRPTRTDSGARPDRAFEEPLFGGSVAPVRPADATGPMPAVGRASSEAPHEPPAARGALPPTAADATGPWPVAPLPPPAAEADPGTPVDRSAPTGAWSFDSATGAPHTDAWSFAAVEQPPVNPEPAPRPTPRRRARAVGEPPPDAPTASPTSAPAADGLPKRMWWPLTVAGVLLAVVTGVVLVFSVARTDPGELVAAAATDVGSWNGVRYRGAVAALDGGEIQFELTVTADGAVGTLSRDGGRATAELLRDGSGTLVMANREWWRYHHPSRADDLADSWVADPLTETKEIDPVLELDPAALAQQVRPGQQPAQWEALEQQVVDGQSTVVLSDGRRRVVVTAEEPHRLLGLDIRAAEGSAPVRVTEVTAEEAGPVEWDAARIRNPDPPRSLTQRLLERPLVEIELRPEPLCATATCAVTVTVTNSGTIPARGHLEISADGNLVATHPLDVQPGQVARFAATAPNPQFTSPGSSGQILWESRAVDD